MPDPTPEPSKPAIPKFSGLTFGCSDFRTEWHLPETIKMPPQFQAVYDQAHKEVVIERDPKSSKESRKQGNDYAIAAVDGVYVRFSSGLSSKDPIQISWPARNGENRTRLVKFIKATGESGAVPPNTIFFLKLTGLGDKLTGPRLIPVLGAPPDGALILDLKPSSGEPPQTGTNPPN